MINFIKTANEEFENHERSTRFIRMEDKIVALGNPIQVYYFARYVRGANIEKLQEYMLDSGDYEIIFYFLKHVKGANASQFILKAARSGEMFWARKYAEIGRSRHHEGVSQILKNMTRSGINLKLKESYESLDAIVERACKLYKSYGRNEIFDAIEKEIIYSPFNGDKALFVRDVEGADIAAFERDCALTADPFNAYLLALQVPKANKILLLKSLELAKYDYAKIDEDLIKRNAEITSINNAIIDCQDIDKRKQLQDRLKATMDNLTYLERLDEYKFRIRGLILEQQR